MKSDKSNVGSGKTAFNRAKANGQSWLKLRQDAIAKGTWRKGK